MLKSVTGKFVVRSFTSPFLHLSISSRSCLGLFREVSLAIQSELNLIASLSLLDDFGINILPVQVRLCDNKLDIIRNVLDSSHGAYKRYEKVEKSLIPYGNILATFYSARKH